MLPMSLPLRLLTLQERFDSAEQCAIEPTPYGISVVGGMRSWELEVKVLVLVAATVLPHRVNCQLT